MVSIWTPTPSGCVHVTPGPWRVSNRSPCLRTCVKLQMVPGSLDPGPSVWTATSRVYSARYWCLCWACCSWLSKSLFLLSSSWTLARKQRNRRFRVLSTWILEPRSFLKALVTAPEALGMVHTGADGVSEKKSEFMSVETTNNPIKTCLICAYSTAAQCLQAYNADAVVKGVTITIPAVSLPQCK